MRSFPATRSILTSLLIAATAVAQSEFKSARYYKSYGPSSANVFVDLQARGSRSLIMASANASADVVAGANILGFTARAMSIRAAGSAGISQSASLKVVLAGITLLNDTRSTTSAWSRSFGPYDLFPVEPFIGVTIAGIKVGVSCNVGAGAQAGYNINPSSTSVGLSGYGRIYGTGRAKASAGALGFEAGVRADLRILDSKGTPWVVASTSGVSGALLFELKPLAITLTAYLKAPWPIGEVGSSKIWSWSMASFWDSYPVL